MNDSDSCIMSTIDTLQLPSVTTPGTSRDVTAKLATLQETLAENILLKRELRTKLEQILSLRMELRNSFEHRALEADTSTDETGLLHRSFYGTTGGGDSHREMYRLLESAGFLNGSMFPQEQGDEAQPAIMSLSQSLIEWVGMNRSEVIDKVSTGTMVARDLTLGAVSGWGSAYVMKKFGTTALTAIGGGLLLIQLANRGGYVVVDWNQIYSRLERSATELDTTGETNGTFDNDPSSSSDWFISRIKRVRKWAVDNRHFALGFFGGFFYKTYA